MNRNPSATRWLLALLAAGVFAAGSVIVAAQSPGAPAQQPSEAASAQSPQAAPAQQTPDTQQVSNVPDPTPPTHEQIGDSLMAHQRYQAAVEEYKQSPHDSAEAWNKLGVAYELLLDNNDASKCYSMALKIDPHSSVALNNMGAIYMARKEYSRAEHSYRKAVKLDPGSALFRKNLGTALLAERDYKKGWDAYQQALAIDPEIFAGSGSVRVENPGAIQDRGAMNFYMAKGCVKAGQTALAIQYLRLALNEGFTTPKKIIADAEFASLRDLPAFQQMMAAQGVYLTAPGAHSAVQ